MEKIQLIQMQEKLEMIHSKYDKDNIRHVYENLNESNLN